MKLKNCLYSTLKNFEGQLVPNVAWPYYAENSWKSITSDQVFGKKTVVAFSLPGAFTPTCSSSHLPRYNELATTFKKHGVDQIVCIAVNDTFVMSEWSRNQKCSNVMFIADGNKEFTEKIGMLVDKSKLGFGHRSWRYSMLVKDKVVDKMFIEPQREGDPFEVSDADTMLQYIAPGCRIPESIAILTKRGCIVCEKAKKLLQSQGLHFNELIVGENLSATGLRAFSGVTTVPQIFSNGKSIGGYEALVEFCKTV